MKFDTQVHIDIVLIIHGNRTNQTTITYIFHTIDYSAVLYFGIIPSINKLRANNFEE